MSSRASELLAHQSLTRLRVGASVAMIPIRMGLGANLKRLREARQDKRTAAEVAKAAGMSAQQFSDYETGRIDGNPKLTTVFKLAKAVPCTVEELIEGVDAEYDAVARRASSYKSYLVTGLGVSSAQAQPINPAAAIGGNPRGSLAEDHPSQSIVDATHLAGIANDERLLTIARQLSAVSGDLNALVRPPDSSGANRAPGRDTSGPDVSRPPAHRKTQR